MKELLSKNIAVFGASSGLGEALVPQLVNEKATVFAVSRSITSHSLPEGVIKIDCDVTDSISVSNAFDAISQHADDIDIVITTVGEGLVKNFEETTAEEIRRLNEVGLIGTEFVMNEAYKRMIPQGRGHLISTSSTTGLEGKAQEVVYSGVKHAIRGFNQALSKEAVVHGIEATCIFPGGMRSEKFWGKALPSRDYSSYMEPIFVAKKVVRMLKKDPPHPVEMVIRRPKK